MDMKKIWIGIIVISAIIMPTITQRGKADEDIFTLSINYQDGSGNPYTYTNIYVRNINTAEELQLQTDGNGEAAVDIDDFVMGVHNGDVIEVEMDSNNYYKIKYDSIIDNVKLTGTIDPYNLLIKSPSSTGKLGYHYCKISLNPNSNIDVDEDLVINQQTANSGLTNSYGNYNIKINTTIQDQRSSGLSSKWQHDAKVDPNRSPPMASACWVRTSYGSPTWSDNYLQHTLCGSLATGQMETVETSILIYDNQNTQLALSTFTRTFYL